MGTTVIIDGNNNNGAQVSAVAVPSVSDMIGASVTAPESSGSTTLDDLHIEITNGDDIVTTQSAPKKRGRPAGSGKAEKVAAKTKADLVADNARLQSALDASLARQDTQRLGELSKSIELASYLLFGIAATKRGPHWQMGETEAKNIGEAGANASAPYVASLSQQLPIIVFVGVLANSVYDRVREDKKLLAEWRAAREPT